MKTFYRLFFVVFCLGANGYSSHAQWVNAKPSIGKVYAFASLGTKLFAGSAAGLGVSTDNGASWTPVDNGIPLNRDISALAASDTIIFAGGYYDGVFRSTDNGTSWRAVNTGLSNRKITALAFQGANIVAGIDSGTVFLSTNNGESWASIGKINSTPTRLNPIMALVVSGTDLYAGTADGIYRLTDNFTNWVCASNNPVYSMTASGSNLFAGTIGGRILVSTDKGASWAVSQQLYPSYYTWAVAVSGANMMAGTGDGVFLSTNNNQSWSPTGLIATTVTAVSFSGPNLVAGTNSLGIWIRPLSELTSLSEQPCASPMHFVLDQNYPNPFNPSTTISFGLPERSHVSLKIFDVMGREVATLVSEELPAGTYQRQWNASGFLSGVYFYRLTAGSYTETKRLMLMK